MKIIPETFVSNFCIKICGSSITPFLGFSLPTAIQFMFGHANVGNEAVHSQSTLDVIVPVVLSISTSTAVLPADTIVIISIQPGGSATCRSFVSFTC